MNGEASICKGLKNTMNEFPFPPDGSVKSEYVAGGFRGGNSLSETGGRHHGLADRVQRLRILGPGQQTHHRALGGIHSGAGNP